MVPRAAVALQALQGVSPPAQPDLKPQSIDAGLRAPWHRSCEVVGAVCCRK